MESDASGRALAGCALLIITALYVVGFVSHGVLRHIVQTLPVWPAVVLGFRNSGWSKWVALPCFLLWLFLMTLIWLFLLGWARVISGTFSPVEIAMTAVVGAASLTGIAVAVRARSGKAWAGALVVFLGILALEIVAMRVSFLPGIAHD